MIQTLLRTNKNLWFWSVTSMQVGRWKPNDQSTKTTLQCEETFSTCPLWPVSGARQAEVVSHIRDTLTDGAINQHLIVHHFLFTSLHFRFVVDKMKQLLLGSMKASKKMPFELLFIKNVLHTKHTTRNNWTQKETTTVSKTLNASHTLGGFNAFK